MQKALIAISFLLSAVLLVSGARADQAGDIHALQTRWAEVKYQVPETQRLGELEKLIDQAEALRKAHPKEAPYMIWEAVIRSTYAGAKGGISVLGQVKTAKKLLEEAIALDPDALNGSAYTTLGALYYQVPGWPIGFGDDDKAKAMLLKGLTYNPDGMDANYFYGDFLLDQKQYQQALTALQKALAAPPRPNRLSADAGRKLEIEKSISKVKEHLGDS